VPVGGGRRSQCGVQAQNFIRLITQVDRGFACSFDAHMQHLSLELDRQAKGDCHLRLLGSAALGPAPGPADWMIMRRNRYRSRSNADRQLKPKQQVCPTCSPRLSAVSASSNACVLLAVTD
jgi:hypothetical protein